MSAMNEHIHPLFRSLLADFGAGLRTMPQPLAPESDETPGDLEPQPVNQGDEE